MWNVHRQVTILILAACPVGSLLPHLFAQASGVSIGAVIDSLRKGENAEALRMSSELLRTDPQSYKVWTLRALAFEQSTDSKQALAAYERALKIAPDYLPALEGAAQLDYKTQSSQAVPVLRHIVSLQPGNTTAHAMLGVLEYRHSEFGAAVQDFEAAGQVIDSKPDALMAYAICLDRLNRAPEAIARFQQLLTLRPVDAAARYDLALVQWRSGAGADALATLGPMLDAKTADSRVLRLAAAIHESNDETPQAVELLRAAILSNPDDPANYVDFATLSFTHGSYSVGIDVVNVGLTRLPGSAALYMARGVLYGQNGEFEKAMADFEHAQTLDPTASMAASAEGIAQSQRHNHEEALADFRRQVHEHPKDAFGYYLLAEALSWSPPEAKQGSAPQSLAEAISAAAKAVELDPQLVQAYDLLASLDLQADQPERAVKACRAALSIKPKDQQAVYSLILALRKTGAKDELKGLVQSLIDLRKQEQADNNLKNRYGQLVEEP
jgi:tetratricopeptide (TPR) repeat protein